MARDIAQEIIDSVRSGSPDYVVTGLMQEREDKIRNEGLAGKVPTTSNIMSYAKSVLGGVGGGSGNSAGGQSSVIRETSTGGVLQLEPDPLFNPNEYLGGSSYTGTTGTTASSGINDILGYVIVFLVGIALLDRFMNSGRKR